MKNRILAAVGAIALMLGLSLGAAIPANAAPATIQNTGTQTLTIRYMNSTTNYSLAPGSSTSNVRYILVYPGKCLIRMLNNNVLTRTTDCPTQTTFYEMGNGGTWQVRTVNK